MEITQNTKFNEENIEIPFEDRIRMLKRDYKLLDLSNLTFDDIVKKDIFINYKKNIK